MGPLAAAIIAGGSLIGSAMAGKNKSEQAQTTNEPWSGIQPYLIGKEVPAWARDPYVGQGAPQQGWLDYIASLGAGNYLTPQGQVIQPPPAFANDPRLIGPDAQTAAAQASQAAESQLAQWFELARKGMNHPSGSDAFDARAPYAQRQSGLSMLDFMRQYRDWEAQQGARNDQWGQVS